MAHNGVKTLVGGQLVGYFTSVAEDLYSGPKDLLSSVCYNQAVT